MTLLEPDYSFEEFEHIVGEILKESLPYGVLSRVPVFRADTDEDWMHANEIDHLLHFQVRGVNHLVLVECKSNSITSDVSDSYGDAPKNTDHWYVHYQKNGESKPTDVKEQMKVQAKALLQYLGDSVDGQTVIECWVVHRRKDCEMLKHDQQGINGILFRAFNHEQLENQLPSMTHSDRPLTINRSKYLAPISESIPKPNHPHPPVLDALNAIKKSHHQIDRQLFQRFNDWFKSKDERWAIKGTAGSGKSVLMAYTLAALSTNYRIATDSNDRLILERLDENFLPGGIAPFRQRRIQVFSRSQFQLDLLQNYYNFFIDQISSLREGNPETCYINFSVWRRQKITRNVNFLAIDEAHDLTLEDQDLVSQWYHAKEGFHRHVTVAIDRHQQLRDSKHSDPLIIKGLNFSNRTNEMTRNYRSPFTIYVAAISLLFRWQAEEGVQVRPETTLVKKFKKPFWTFKNGINLTVIEKGDECQIYLRNDSHPGNFWGRTIDLYRNGSDLLEMLERERLSAREVKWLRFEKFPNSVSERLLGEKYQFFDIRSGDIDDFIDENIKGDEFPIMIVEGLPENIDNLENPEAMWHARRQLYTCTSRATAFLFFVLPPTETNSRVRNEIWNIISNLERPEKEKANETGFKWSMKFRWLPDTIGVTDYEDAVVANIEREDQSEES